MTHTSLHDIVKSHLCIGCGLCTIDSNTKGSNFNKKNDCYTPKVYDKHCNLALQICPGKGYEIVNIAKKRYDNENSQYDLELGYIHSCLAVHTSDTKILENASSGGIITSILLYLLNNKIVDKVSVTQFECNKEGVKTKSFLTNNPAEILKAQGSKYCPVNLDYLVKELHEYNGKVAIVATPCVIAGIRNIQNVCPDYIKSDIVFTIANFCGGFKSYKNIKRLAEIHQVNILDLKDFRFRGGGQPGSLRFVENGGKESQTPYPQYVGLNGYSKMYRCHVCPDATGELADIACGDAWIPRFEQDSSPWSMVICRSASATDLLSKMKEDKSIVTQDVSLQEIKQSQRYNLASKKKRQKARMNLYSRLGYKIPLFDGGFYDNCTSMKTEWTVFFKHKLTLWAEKTGLYMSLYGKKKLNKKK